MSPEAPPPRAVRVMLVDDLAEVRRLLRLVLGGDPRFSVVAEAADGFEAVRTAAALRPDLILLDVVMPRRGGLETLPRLRQAAPGSKVVVLSALEDRSLETEVRSLGAVGYLDKALAPAELRQGLIAMLGTLEAIDEGMSRANSRLAAEVASAGSARRFVERTVGEWDPFLPLDVIKLLVSELVVNAVLHARSEAEVSVVLRQDRVRVAVTDRSPTLPVVKDPGPYDTSGRGMALVQSLASAWGVERLAEGKRVWFEVPRADAAPGPAAPGPAAAPGPGQEVVDERT